MMNTKMHNEQNLKEVLPKKVWEIITEAVFGDWDVYKTYKGKEFPDEYKSAIFFARKHHINTPEKAMAFRALIKPIKIEKPIVVEEVYGEVIVGDFRVPTTSTKTGTKKTGKGRRTEGSPKRVLSVEERIQNHLAQVVWKARDNNYRLAVEDVKKFESIAKNMEKLWREKFLNLNSNSDTAKQMLDKLHYPKAVMSYWIKKYELNK